MGYRIVKQEKKPKEHSKKIADNSLFVCLALTIYVMVWCWKTNDATPLIYLIPGWMGELAAVNVFYYKKAEKENAIKLAKKYKLEVVEDEHTNI